ncbi:hypothetical protein A9R05_42905 (plasmid) [Burkholderia sp. KK1]|uniref:Uncharacterized protein n=1 Tax=Burkholderia sp. M701 TaxID=326454 RepID=V5YQ02_9BURK|nr:hypothetical protein [Burkholderia sp. M701]AQH05770.1 hypothetical protein A9R05_42905 [Burkholderia sp. KK1]BAO18996.1 hypothetical protein [Burkholderia sp. M701]
MSVEGMTVEDAVAHLRKIVSDSHRGREQRLAVAYDPGTVSVGGTPHKLVQNIYPGIDWDMGLVFFDLGSRLCAPGEEQETRKLALRRAQDALARISLALQSNLTAEARLEAIGLTIQAWRYRPSPASTRQSRG